MDEHRPLPESDLRPLHASPASSDVEAPETTYAVGDFIRAQVERRWGLDAAALGGKALAVLVRVEITNTGTVTKAEIVRNGEFASDKSYQDAARSARNAVILSCPFTLPAGNYNPRMDGVYASAGHAGRIALIRIMPVRQQGRFDPAGSAVVDAPSH